MLIRAQISSSPVHPVAHRGKPSLASPVQLSGLSGRGTSKAELRSICSWLRRREAVLSHPHSQFAAAQHVLIPSPDITSHCSRRRAAPTRHHPHAAPRFEKKLLKVRAPFLSSSRAHNHTRMWQKESIAAEDIGARARLEKG